MKSVRAVVAVLGVVSSFLTWTSGASAQVYPGVDYYLVNRSGGTVMQADVDGQGALIGNNLVVGGWRDASHQRFRVEQDAGGYLAIVNIKTSRVVDIPASSKEAGKGGLLWSRHGGANQQFNLIPVPDSDGYWWILNRNSNLALEASGNAERSSVVQKPLDRKNWQQQWRFSKLGGDFREEPATEDAKESGSVFLFIGDPQITTANVDGTSDYDRKMSRYVTIVNKLRKFTWPSKIDGVDTNFALAGRPITPEFMVMGGDLTQWGGGWAFGMDGDALAIQWVRAPLLRKFLEYFDRDFSSRAIQLPMYVGLGNHDLNHDYEHNALDRGIFRRNMRKYVEIKHEPPDAQVPVGNFDSASGSYSWDVGDVHFIQLHRFGGDDIDNRRWCGQTHSGSNHLKKDFQEANNCLHWIRSDLEKTGKGKHIVLFQHYGWDGSGLGGKDGLYAWWTPKEVEELDRILLDYKVTRFHGHTHMDQFYFHEDYYKPEHLRQGRADPVFCVQAASPSHFMTRGAEQSYADEAGFLVAHVTRNRTEVVYCSIDQLEQGFNESSLQFTSALRVRPRQEGDAAKLSGTPPELRWQKPVNYECKIYTSDVSGAGTDSDIYLKLIGSKRESSWYHLNSMKPKLYDVFKRSSVETFVFSERDLGTIEKIKIRSKKSGFGPDWHVRAIQVVGKFGREINDWVKAGEYEWTSQ